MSAGLKYSRNRQFFQFDKNVCVFYHSIPCTQPSRSIVGFFAWTVLKTKRGPSRKPVDVRHCMQSAEIITGLVL
jgi:hypothetical protein